jgi:hypothetical protein
MLSFRARLNPLAPQVDISRCDGLQSDALMLPRSRWLGKESAFQIHTCHVDSSCAELDDLRI